MKFIIKEKQMSIGDDFSIKDESGREVFYVDGYGFSFGQKLAFLDSRKNKVGMIKQKLFTMRPSFSLQQNGKEVAVVKKALLSFGPNFKVDVKGPDDFQIKGRLIEHEYKFFKNGKEVAVVSKKFLSMSDAYVVDILDNDSAFIVLASAIVIDLSCHPDKRSKRR